MIEPPFPKQKKLKEGKNFLKVRVITPKIKLKSIRRRFFAIKLLLIKM